MNGPDLINGILLLYYLPRHATAPTTLEHIEAIPHYSKHAVWPINVARGFPPGLRDLRFRIVVLHYSLFGPPVFGGSWPSGLSPRFKRYLLQSSESYRVAFFQDEHHYCQARFAFLNTHKIQCVYTLLAPKHWDDVYRKYTSVEKLVHTLTGYVSSDLADSVQTVARPDAMRTIDIGYRARRLPFYMGRGAQEKADIADEFVRRAQGSGLALDVSADEGTRIYGDAWWQFVANCRGMLGVEAGPSIFDLDDRVRIECGQLLRSNPSMTFDQAHDRLLYKWEGKIPYRVISPRLFEAAAMRVCQILFEGEYQGVLRPFEHYIPLKKDFSNFGQVLDTFRDREARLRIADNAYHHLIASGAWSYRQFVTAFDEELDASGLYSETSPSEQADVSRRLEKGAMLLELQGRLVETLHANFPGRRALATVARRILD